MACTSDPSAAASFVRHALEGPGAANAGPGPPDSATARSTARWFLHDWYTTSINHVSGYSTIEVMAFIFIIITLSYYHHHHNDYHHRRHHHHHHHHHHLYVYTYTRTHTRIII